MEDGNLCVQFIAPTSSFGERTERARALAWRLVLLRGGAGTTQADFSFALALL